MHVDSRMATRITDPSKRKLSENCTEFHLHKSQQGLGGRNVFDYSEYRLILHINVAEDEQLKLSLKDVLTKYKKGLIAVAWKAGRPVWINVTKEQRRT